MRRLVIFACLFAAAAAGCQNLAGPVQARRMGPAESPYYSKDEWLQRDRQRTTRVEDGGLMPKTFVDRPSPTGR